MSWFYEEHDKHCDCDTCEGARFVERHVPDDCLFDDNDRHHRYQDEAKQKRAKR